MELTIQRQHEINYIRNLILGNDMTILNNFEIGDSKITFDMYKDIIDMIRTIREYINNNIEDPESLTDTHTTKEFTLKSRIFRKNMKRTKEHVQPINDKFDIEFYSSLLRDIIFSHEVEKIK